MVQHPPTAAGAGLTGGAGGFVRDDVVVAIEPAEDVSLHIRTSGDFCFLEFDPSEVSVILVLPNL